MRIRELYQPNILIMITNEEAAFLKKHRDYRIDLNELKDREKRIAENLLFKDILCKISDHEVVSNEFGSQEQGNTRQI